MAPTDVHLVKVRNAAISRCHRNIFELHIHIIFSFKQLSSVNLPGCDLESDNMALRLVEQLDRNPDGTG